MLRTVCEWIGAIALVVVVLMVAAWPIGICTQPRHTYDPMQEDEPCNGSS